MRTAMTIHVTSQDRYGPFQANHQVNVPIWLAILLKREKKCDILPPAWLKKDRLAGGAVI